MLPILPSGSFCHAASPPSIRPAPPRPRRKLHAASPDSRRVRFVGAAIVDFLRHFQSIRKSSRDLPISPLGSFRAAGLDQLGPSRNRPIGSSGSFCHGRLCGGGRPRVYPDYRRVRFDSTPDNPPVSRFTERDEVTRSDRPISPSIHFTSFRREQSRNIHHERPIGLSYSLDSAAIGEDSWEMEGRGPASSLCAAQRPKASSSLLECQDGQTRIDSLCSTPDDLAHLDSIHPGLCLWMRDSEATQGTGCGGRPTQNLESRAEPPVEAPQG